jgi:hypothetical protein
MSSQEISQSSDEARIEPILLLDSESETESEKRTKKKRDSIVAITLLATKLA